MKKKTRILKLVHDDPEREFEFELEYLMSLTTQQRYKMMFERSREMMERMIRYGHIKPVEIIKRAARPVRRHRRNRVSKARFHARDRRH